MSEFINIGLFLIKYCPFGNTPLLLMLFTKLNNQTRIYQIKNHLLPCIMSMVSFIQSYSISNKLKNLQKRMYYLVAFNNKVLYSNIYGFIPGLWVYVPSNVLVHTKMASSFFSPNMHLKPWRHVREDSKLSLYFEYYKFYNWSYRISPRILATYLADNPI